MNTLTRDIEQQRVGAVRSQRAARDTEVLSSVRVLEAGQTQLRPETVRDAAALHVWRAGRDKRCGLAHV